MVLSVIGLGVNDLLMWLGSSVLGVSYLIVKIVATAIVMVYNFVTRKIFLTATPAPSSSSERATPPFRKRVANSATW